MPTKSFPHVRSLVAIVVVASVTTGCASQSSAPSAAVSTPTSKIAAPTGSKFAMKLPAVGVQIYKCAQADGKFNWAFVAPEADLFNEGGKLIGKHGAGPFWELFDGSKVNGSVAQREDSPRPGAIVHLLLTTKSTGGAGAVANVKHLQRVNTLGGVAPSAGCAAPGDVDKQARVYYTADYYLYE
jgi:Protein of unknown function (DUF3455)